MKMKKNTFFDIAGAFDNAPTKVIIKGLSERKTDLIISDWIERLLQNRILTATKGTTTIKTKATRGCPQGGVLSPLLWRFSEKDPVCHALRLCRGVLLAPFEAHCANLHCRRTGLKS